MDIYLSGHIDTLIGEIQKRAIIQSFSPFRTVELDRMARAFSMSVPDLESELISLCNAKKISGKIDSTRKIFHAVPRHTDADAFEKYLHNASNYENSVRSLLLRMSLLHAEMVVRSPKPDSTSKRA